MMNDPNKGQRVESAGEIVEEDEVMNEGGVAATMLVE